MGVLPEAVDKYYEEGKSYSSEEYMEIMKKIRAESDRIKAERKAKGPSSEQRQKLYLKGQEAFRLKDYEIAMYYWEKAGTKKAKENMRRVDNLLDFGSSPEETTQRRAQRALVRKKNPKSLFDASIARAQENINKLRSPMPPPPPPKTGFSRLSSMVGKGIKRKLDDLMTIKEPDSLDLSK
jgi:hypothetical protein